MNTAVRTVTVIPPSINPMTYLADTPLYKLRVAAYARVSTDSDEQFTSYEAQIDYYTQYIQRNPEWTFVKVYTDVYNQRLIPFDTKKAVQTLKITAFEGKNANRKPLFLFCEVMMPDCWVHQCTQAK